MNIWNHLSGWAITALGFTAVGIAAAFWSRLKKLLEPLFDPIIAWIADRLPWHRRLHKVRDLLTAVPKKAAKPAATQEQGASQPSEQVDPASPRRLTECELPVPLFTSHPRQEDAIQLPCSWRWKADNIVDFRIHCPSCKNALALGIDRRLKPPTGFYTKLACSKCHWTRRFEGSPDGLTRMLVAYLYSSHRERGLL